MSTLSKICTLIHVHDDHWFLGQTIEAWSAYGDVFCFVSRVAWDGTVGDWEKSRECAQSAGAQVIEGEWLSEDEQRTFGYQYVRELGFEFALTPDGDEIPEPELLAAVLECLTTGKADRVHVRCATYWKSPHFRISPMEEFSPQIGVNLNATRQGTLRAAQGGVAAIISESVGILHHLSYAGPDERIRRKIQTYSHRQDVVEGWWHRVWKAWDSNPLMRDIHPTHPPAYGFAEPIECPTILERCVLEDGQILEDAGGYRTPHASVSIVIPLYGGESDIRLCLESLQKSADLIQEVVVVDNASPDSAAEIASQFDFVTLIRNDSNLGFARACNQGFEASSGNTILFLNSDTIVPRNALIHLVDCLCSYDFVGAVGPHTNCAASQQQVQPTYTSLNGIEPFSRMWAKLRRPDTETDLLIGFCFAMRRSVCEQVGVFDDQFEIGMFEDNDLSYRLRRAGFKLLISGKGYVHHSGSKSFARQERHPATIYKENQIRFHEKWKEDIQLGFASHLPAESPHPIIFDQAKKPELLRWSTAQRALTANISLCMIVRNEERVIGDCLSSAKPYFSQIVVVDTGSSDRTKEIAGDHGAEVHELVWPESFSEARNESLKHAEGDWVMWIDADDTLPPETGEAILDAAIHAPSQIHAFVVPVQFVDEGENSGTRVDHVKLFRNRKGIHFEGHIHEQNLPSIRAAGGEVARINAVVLHSGYDTSEEGQKKKAIRDRKLLAKDYAERPRHPFVLFNIGMTRHYSGMHREAVGWLERCIRNSTDSESHVSKAFVLLANSLRALGRNPEAETTLRNGIKAHPNDPELRFTLAHHLSASGNGREAVQWYESVLTIDTKGQFSSLDIGILGFKTYHNMASLLLELDGYEAAKPYWIKAIASAPDQLALAHVLFMESMKARDWITAQEMLEHVRHHEPALELWSKMLRDYTSTTQGSGSVVSALERASATYPRSIAVQAAYARELAQSGREPEAEPLLTWLAWQGHAESAYYLGVLNLRRGDYHAALAWTQRSFDLAPNHEGCAKQLQNLKDLVNNRKS